MFIDSLMINFWRLFLLIVVLSASFGAGAAILHLAGYNRQAPTPTSDVLPLLSITLGLGVIAYVMLAIGLLGWLHPYVIWGLLMVSTASGILLLKKTDIQSSLNGLLLKIKSLRELNWPFKLLLCIFFVFVFVNLIGAMAPPLGVDDVKYHLAIPKRYADSGSITYIPDCDFSNFPFTMEMLWTLAIGIDSGELAQLINWSIGLLIVGWVVILGRMSELKPWLILIAVLLFYSITTVGYQSRSGMAELGGTLFFLASIYLIFLCREHKTLGLLLLGGVFAGLFASSKISHAAMVILLTIWIGISFWRRDQSLQTGLISGILFGGAAFAVAGVWYLKTFLMTGNPVYPFFQSLLGGPQIHMDLFSWGSDKMFLVDDSLKHLRKVPEIYFTQIWRLIANPQKLRGHVSPLFVGLLPLVVLYLFHGTRKLRQISVVAGLFYLYWVALYPLIRIGLPLFALLAIPTAFAFGKLSEQGLFARATLSVALLVWLLSSLGNHLREVLPAVPVVFGNKPRAEYIAERGSSRFHFHNYAAHSFMNTNLPPDSRVLLWSNDGYYLERPYIYAGGFITLMANGERLYAPDQVIDEMKRFGITHVAMTDESKRRRLRETLEATGKLRKLYEDANMVICALAQETVNYPNKTE